MNFKIVRQAKVTIQITHISQGKNIYTSSTNVRKAESPDEHDHKNDHKSDGEIRNIPSGYGISSCCTWFEN